MKKIAPHTAAEAALNMSALQALNALLGAATNGKRDHGAEAAAARLLELQGHTLSMAEVAERAEPGAAYETVKPRITSGDISSTKAIFDAGFAAGGAHAAVALKVLDWILPSLQSMHKEVEFGCAAEVDAVQQVLTGQAPTFVGQPSADLKQRCSEISNWRSSGTLEGQALADHAKRKYGEASDALQLAELETVQEVLSLIAQSPAKRELMECNDPAGAAIQFALNNPTEDIMAFLHCWNEGNFEALRREWPEAPEDVYIGADVLYKAPQQAPEGPL